MRFIGSTGLAALAAAIIAWGPAGAIEIDPDNLPPWPARHIGQIDMPSRFDKAPIEEILAAKDAGNHEAGVVFLRRQWAGDPAVLAWARAGEAVQNTRAMVILGHMLSKTDRPEAIRLYRAAAELGDTEAMRNLASAYLEGDGVEKNAPEALRLYTAAAEKGDGSAIYTLVNLYSGRGSIPRDPEALARWQAAQRENNEPRIEMGSLPPPSPPVDKAPLLEAARAGDPVAMRKLAAAYEADYADKAAPAEAFRWYKAAAEKGDASGMFSLGQAYRSGRVVKADDKLGVEWIIKSAKAGNRTAMYNLSTMYARGDGVKADAEQAQYWKYQWFWSPDMD